MVNVSELLVAHLLQLRDFFPVTYRIELPDLFRRAALDLPHEIFANAHRVISISRLYGSLDQRGGPRNIPPDAAHQAGQDNGENPSDDNAALPMLREVAPHLVEIELQLA